MSDDEWIPYAEAHAAVNDHGYGWTRLSLALVGGQVRSRGRKAEDPDGEPVEIKREPWAEWVFDPERSWLIPRGIERRRAPVGFIEVRFLRSDIERLAEEYARRADAPSGVLAKSYFDDPRWPLNHALNWIACRRIEALTLTPEELRSLRFRAIMLGDAGALAGKNPAHELLTALKAGKLKAIGPDHKELPTEYWDGKSFAYWTWPEIRLRREDMLHEWPHVNALGTDEGSQTEARSSQANVPDGSECPSPSVLDSTRDLPEQTRPRTARLAERVAAEFVQMFPEGRPAMKVKELLAEVQSRPGVGTVSLRTVETAIPLAWSRGPHRTA